MIAHRFVFNIQTPQQHPVQLALHHAEAENFELGIVQGDGVHRIKWVCKTCKTQKVIRNMSALAWLAPSLPRLLLVGQQHWHALELQVHCIADAFQSGASSGSMPELGHFCVSVLSPTACLLAACAMCLTWIGDIFADISGDTKCCKLAIRDR